MTTVARTIATAVLAGTAIIAGLLLTVVLCCGAVFAGLLYRCGQALARALRRAVETVR